MSLSTKPLSFTIYTNRCIQIGVGYNKYTKMWYSDYCDSDSEEKVFESIVGLWKLGEPSQMMGYVFPVYLRIGNTLIEYKTLDDFTKGLKTHFRNIITYHNAKEVRNRKPGCDHDHETVEQYEKRMRSYYDS